MEKSLKVRRHGFESPYHPIQVSGWVVSIYTGLVICVLTFPEYNTLEATILSIIYSFLTVFYVYFGHFVTKSDPTDPAILVYKASQDKQYLLLRLLLELEEKNERFCGLCSCPVHISSKHCIRCGRCTIGFDHHCKWVNNCIGSQNYRHFIYLVVVVEFYYLFLSLNFAYVLALLIYDKENYISSGYDKTSTFFYFDACFIGLGIFFSTIISAFNGYLIAFHIYLKLKGLTTYQYIINKVASKVRPTNKDLESKNQNSKNFCNSEGVHLDNTILSRDPRLSP